MLSSFLLHWIQLFPVLCFLDMMRNICSLFNRAFLIVTAFLFILILIGKKRKPNLLKVMLSSLLLHWIQLFPVLCLMMTSLNMMRSFCFLLNCAFLIVTAFLFILMRKKVLSNHISILYPTQDDFNHFDERAEPQIFNYLCLHGNQLFITSVNRQYEVVSAGWIPKDCQNITNLERIKTYHCLFRTKQFEIAYMKFFGYVKELVRKSVDYQLELF